MSDAIATLPTSGDSSQWTEQEKALVEAAGLVYTERRDGPKKLADRPTVEAFLLHCRRTGLDPIARQIYAIRRAGKFQIQISIDGARLVAERTGDYEGQTTPEFTADGVTWTQVWLSEDPPKAARVGVYRRGFREALYAIALWDAYAVYQDEWSGGKKTGAQVLSAMWSKMGPLMLAKCGEMLALRKAFPQDLSGLYSTEEMAQAGGTAPVTAPADNAIAALVPAAQEPVVADGVVSRDWAVLADGLIDLDDLRALWRTAQEVNEIGLVVPDGRKVGDVILDRRKVIEARPVPVEPESKPVVLDGPREPIGWAVAPIPGSDVPSDADAPDEDYSVMDAIADAEGDR